MDDSVAGTAAININEGTLKPGGSTETGVHQKNELCYAVASILYLDDEPHDLKPGMVVFIAGGTNTLCTLVKQRISFCLHHVGKSRLQRRAPRAD